MTPLLELHVHLYRRFVKLMPPAHQRRHGDDQVQLFADLIATGHRPWRLWAAAIPDLLHVLAVSPRRIVMSHLARAALVPLSILNAGAGLTLAAIALMTSAVPIWVVAPAGAVATQGLYTLVWLVGRVPARSRNADLLFAFGEGAGLVLGATGVVAAAIRQSATADPEYGPPVMLTLVAVHSLVGLLSSPGSRDDDTIAVT